MNKNFVMVITGNVELIFYSNDMYNHTDVIASQIFVTLEELFEYCRDNNITVFVMAENLMVAKNEIENIDALIHAYEIQMTEEQLEYMSKVLFGLKKDEIEWMKNNKYDDITM